MSLFDLFTPGAGTSAANKAYKDIVSGLTGGFSGAQNYLTQGLGDVTGTLQNYGGQAIKALMGGLEPAEGAIKQGIAPYQQLFSEFMPGVNQYFGLLGVGTPGQVEGARAAWQDSPFNKVLQTDISAGTEDLARKGWGAGQTGRTSMDVMDYINNLTQGALGKYEGLLAPSIQGAEASAGGISTGFGNLAKLMAGGGAGVADILSGEGKGIAGAQGATASDLATLINQMKTGIGQAGATKEAQKFGAQQGAATNTLNALFGLGGLALAPFTGGASLMGSLANLFGGGGSTGTGAFDSMMQGSGFMDNAGNIY